MPRTYSRTFAVPEHETNAFGDLFSSSLARFLQQVAIEASADAGFSDAWYREAGTVWVIRRSTIERRGPIRAGDRIELTTWVADFRRVRSRREYVARAPDGATLVEAHTDWVYLDRTAGRLARIPDGMIHDFLDGDDAKALPREPLVVPDPPAEVPASERIVRFRELDGMLHVNNAVYLDYVEEALLDVLAGEDWTPERCAAEGGFLRPARHDLEYLAEARLGDGLRCHSWVGESEGERLTAIRRPADETLLARARSRWVWIDAASGEPAPVPGSLAALLARGRAGRGKPRQPTRGGGVTRRRSRSGAADETAAHRRGAPRSARGASVQRSCRQRNGPRARSHDGRPPA